MVEPVTLDGEPVSSTRIRQAILEGKMDEASRMLGRRFCLRLKVEHGNCIGRLLDFPTINQSFPQHHIVPRYGVYSTVVNVAGKLYGGVTNVGVKPTVGSDRPLSETYILDYSGDLYGQTVEVYFFRFVRPGAEIWLDRRTQGADCPGQRGRGAGGCAEYRADAVFGQPRAGTGNF